MYLVTTSVASIVHKPTFVYEIRYRNAFSHLNSKVQCRKFEGDFKLGFNASLSQPVRIDSAGALTTLLFVCHRCAGVQNSCCRIHTFCL